MLATAWIGWRSPSTDPTWVANAALMVIGPSAKQMGYKRVQRALGTILGVFVGIWLVQVVHGGAVLVIATFAVSFFLIATMNINYIFLTFFWTLYMSLEWAYKGIDVPSAGTEKLWQSWEASPLPSLLSTC